MSAYESKIKRMVSRWSGAKQSNVCRGRTREVNRLARISGHLSAGGVPAGFISESRKTPIAARCQVLVVGGGPAGLSAAIAARRAGADTLIVERFGCFGGVITHTGMETLGWYRYNGCVDTEGIGREMERVASRMGGTTKWPYNDSECLDAEKFKLVADKLLLENNVRLRLHTMVVDTFVEGGVVRGVIVESKSGREAILADRIIDCTGDADVAYFAGASYTSLPLDKAMGVTSVFNVSGVDKGRFLEYVKQNPKTFADWGGDWDQITTGKEMHLKTPYLGREFERAAQENVIKKEEGVSLNGSWSALSDAGEATNLNLVHLHGVDVTNADSLTRAEIKGREHVQRALKALNHTVPGFETAKLRNYAMTLGVRDSRKIVGRYNLTGRDCVTQARFKDSIGVFPEFLDGYNILVLPTTGRYFQVPFGCLVPGAIDNLLVAGRCVAGDAASHAAMRNMMACCVTGQGAGVAAAVSVRLGQSTQNVDIKAVQAELKRQGAKIE